MISLNRVLIPNKYQVFLVFIGHLVGLKENYNTDILRHNYDTLIDDDVVARHRWRVVGQTLIFSGTPSLPI